MTSKKVKAAVWFCISGVIALALTAIALGGDDRTGHYNIVEFLNGAYKTTVTPGTLASDVTFTLPTSNGTSNYVLRSNGSGATSWVTTLSTMDAADASHNGYLTSSDWTTFNSKLTSPMSAVGDTIYGGASGVATRLPGNTTATKNFLTQTGNGVDSAAPAWGTIADTDVPSLNASKITAGTLAVARGGTNLGSGTSGGVLAYTASGTLASSGELTANAVVVGGGAGVVPSVVTNNSTGTNKFLTQISSGAPSWQVLATTDFPANAALTTPQITTSESLLNGAETRWVESGGANYVGFKAPALSGDKIWTLPTGDGSSGQALTTDGSAALGWSSVLTNPMTTTGDIIYSSNGSGTPARLQIGAATTVLHGGTTPSYSAVALGADVSGTLPIANGGTNKALTLAAGALAWTDADSFEVTAAGTANQILLSTGTTAPVWNTSPFVQAYYSGTYVAGSNVVGNTGTPVGNTSSFTEVVDTGGNFASSVFTAPRAGAYLITNLYNIGTVSGSPSAIEFVVQVNNVDIQNRFPRLVKTIAANDSGSSSTVVNLAVNDTVKMKVVLTSGTNVTFDGSTYSTFTINRLP